MSVIPTDLPPHAESALGSTKTFGLGAILSDSAITPGSREFEIEIECLPDEIPEEFTVDVSELMIGQSIRAGDIPLVGSTKLLSPADSVISHVITIKVEAEPVAAEGAAPAAVAE